MAHPDEPHQGRRACLPLQGMGCGCGENMGGGVGAPLVGALWEGIRCEGHTRQGLGKIHAGRPHQGRHKACPYKSRGGGVEQHGTGGIAGWGCGKRTTKKAGFPPP